MGPRSPHFPKHGQKKQWKPIIKNASKHLTIGGLFIFDVWYSPAVFNLKPSVRVKRMQNANTEVIRIAEPDSKVVESIVDVKYTIIAKNKTNTNFEILNETHCMRHFSLNEIDLIGKMTSFKRIGAEEFVTKHKPSENTWGVCITMEKVENV